MQGITSARLKEYKPYNCILFVFSQLVILIYIFHFKSLLLYQPGNIYY